MPKISIVNLNKLKLVKNLSKRQWKNIIRAKHWYWHDVSNFKSYVDDVTALHCIKALRASIKMNRNCIIACKVHRKCYFYCEANDEVYVNHRFYWRSRTSTFILYLVKFHIVEWTKCRDFPIIQHQNIAHRILYNPTNHVNWKM